MIDIRNKEDVICLVNAFYEKVKLDPLIGPIFSSVIVNDNWDIHLRRMYDFWSTILFGDSSYHGNPFSKHTNLPIESAHFQRWLDLFSETIKENFAGDKADEVLWRADKMRLMFQMKLEQIGNNHNYRNIM